MSIRREAPVVAAAILLACFAALVTPALAGAVTLPAGFSQTTAISGLNRPTDVEIAPNGRVFVAERSGIVKTYSSISDTTATVAADLRTQVHHFSARGLMSLAVDPGFPTQPYIYAYYNLDATIGGTPPLYGTAGQTYDNCAKAPGGKEENCIAAVRISRLQISGEAMTGAEQVLVEDYCHQYPCPHGRRSRVRRRRLPVRVRLGRLDRQAVGLRARPARPPTRAATRPAESARCSPRRPPRAAACACRTCAPPVTRTGLNGSLIRIDPATGAGAPGNPLAASASANERRMLGLRPARLGAARDPAGHERGVGDRPRRRLLGGVQPRA